MSQTVLNPITSSKTDRTPDSIDYLSNVRQLRDEFFRGEWHYIVRPNHANSNWVTCSDYPLSVGGFVNKFVDPLHLLGVSFGDTTNYLVQDIDIGSPYHPANDREAFDRFLTTLEKIGLTAPVIIQSSDSGGIHVYYFLDRPLSTIRIATLVKITLIDAGFHIKDGDLELFPNVKKYTARGEKPSHFKALRLPLQPNSGAMILDRDANISEWANITPQKQIEVFLELAIDSAATNDIDLIEKKLSSAYKKYTKNIDKYQQLSGSKNLSERALEWKQNFETEFQIGWIGKGQTNELLRKFVEYTIVFEGITDRTEICKRVLDRVLNTRGYHEHCRHQPTIVDRIADWVDSNLQNVYSVPYCALPPRRGGEYPSGATRPTSGSGTGVNQHNDATADRAFKRFLDVMDLISDIPSRIGDLHKQIEERMFELFGVTISHVTLYKEKYKAIWMKLFSTNKYADLVPLVVDLGGGVCNKPETHTERELEAVNFQTDNNTLKTLNPIIGETSPTLNHYGRFSTGTMGDGDTLGATEGNLSNSNIQKDKNSLHDSLSQSIAPEIDKLSISPSQPDQSPAAQILDIDTNSHSPLIDCPGEDLTPITFKDRVAAVDGSDDRGIGIVSGVQGSIVEVIWKATKNFIAHITRHAISELRVVDRYSDMLNRQYRGVIVPDQPVLDIGDRVSLTELYDVYGGRVGVIDRIDKWLFHVTWDDRTRSQHSIYELVLIELISQHRQL
jgi:hypothetical protein